MPSNIEAEVKERKVKFIPREHDRYLKRHLPRKALAAIEVINKVCKRFDELLQTENNPAIKEHKLLLEITTSEIISAFSGDEATRWAFIPPVYRHLMVQVGKNLRDPVSAIQQFTNDEKLMRQLDEAWKSIPTETVAEPTQPVEETTSVVIKTEPKPVKSTEDAPFDVRATQNVPSVLIRSRVKVSIKKGATFTVRKHFFRNAEGWYFLTNGVEVPDIFFEDVTPVQEGVKPIKVINEPKWADKVHPVERQIGQRARFHVCYELNGIKTFDPLYQHSPEEAIKKLRESKEGKEIRIFAVVVCNPAIEL